MNTDELPRLLHALRLRQRPQLRHCPPGKPGVEPGDDRLVKAFEPYRRADCLMDALAVLWKVRVGGFTVDIPEIPLHTRGGKVG